MLGIFVKKRNFFIRNIFNSVITKVKKYESISTFKNKVFEFWTLRALWPGGNCWNGNATHEYRKSSQLWVIWTIEHPPVFSTLEIISLNVKLSIGIQFSHLWEPLKRICNLSLKCDSSFGVRERFTFNHISQKFLQQPSFMLQKFPMLTPLGGGGD